MPQRLGDEAACLHPVAAAGGDLGTHQPEVAQEEAVVGDALVAPQCRFQRHQQPVGACGIAFAQPQWAITPGQSVVVYESKVCLGGGIIV